MKRPPVTVIVPFKGGADDARRVATELGGLRTQAGDQLLLVDNSPAPVAAAVDTVRVLRAAAMASSYFARNQGAGEADNEWLLFVDSDCLIPPSLLDDYFSEAPAPDCGIVAGELVAAPGQNALTARYERSRGHLEVAQHLELGPGPAGITANLLVRRAAWSELGGFHEVRSGADLEFCWRAQEAGWTVAYRPVARVEHLHTERLGAMLRKARRYGPGQAWVNRRYPGSAPPPAVAAQIARAIAGSAVWAVTARGRRALYKALDGLWVTAYAAGYWLDDNRPSALEGGASERSATVGIAGAFPADGHAHPTEGGRVVAARRPLRVRRGAFGVGQVDYLEDASPREGVAAATRLAMTRPVRSLRYLRDSGAGKPRLRAIAPGALALKRAGATRLVALDEEGGSLGRHLEQLTGLRCHPSAP